MSTIALIPARQGSKGIPGKNFRKLGSRSLLSHAFHCAREVCDTVVVSSDLSVSAQIEAVRAACRARYLQRPAELASDTAPMIDVVKHAMAELQGQPEDIWILLQPTQPFRKPEHIQQAITLLEESGADSVVSLVDLPRTHHPEFQFVIRDGRAHRGWSYSHEIGAMPTRRQDAKPTYIRDGTVYAFRRQTVERYGNIYGQDVRPLVIDPADSCELDTPEQWTEVERRWKERHGG